MSDETLTYLEEQDLVRFLIGDLVDSNLQSFARASDILSSVVRRNFMVNTIITLPADKAYSAVEVQVVFENLTVVKPRQEAAHPMRGYEPSFPQNARLGKRDYNGEIQAVVKLVCRGILHNGEYGRTVEAQVGPIGLSPFPIMVRSTLCNTYEMNAEALKCVGESPQDKGGYFVSGGAEKVVEPSENIAFCTINVNKVPSAGSKPYEYFLELISQPDADPFGNSSRIQMRLMKNGAIICHINSARLDGTVAIPMGTLFRMFGATSDEEIVSLVGVLNVKDLPPERVHELTVLNGINRRLVDLVVRALQVHDSDKSSLVEREVTDASEIAKRLAQNLVHHGKKTVVKDVNENLKMAITQYYTQLNTTVLPHIGMTAADAPRKLRYLGYCVRQLLLVHLGVVQEMNRDDVGKRRIHDVLPSIVKAFKQMFNKDVVQKLIKDVRGKLTKSASFEAITPTDISQVVMSVLKGPKLSKGMSQIFIDSKDSGNKKRVSAADMERKNPLSDIATGRQMAPHGKKDGGAKATTRAHQQRGVNASQVIYVCPLHSPDTGMGVGWKKQAACTTRFSNETSSLELRATLEKDPKMRSFDSIPQERAYAENLCMVMVNGMPVGWTNEGPQFAKRYLEARRRREAFITPTTAIHWAPLSGEIRFWTDLGRIMAPRIIVSNNLEEFKKAHREGRPIKFQQWSRFKRIHLYRLVQGETTLEGLIADGVIEYVSALETDNCVVAPTFADLEANRNNIGSMYTHVDVSTAIFGIAALLIPFPNRTQPARGTLETNQGRGACGWYNLAYARQGGQKRFFQFFIGMPLCWTLANRLTTPNMDMLMVAYSVIYGMNQEDSAVFSKKCADQMGFAGLFVSTFREVCTRGETITNPMMQKDIANGRTLTNNFSKITAQGIPLEGTVLVAGDVVIGKVKAGTVGSTASQDASTVYNRTVPGRVIMSFLGNSANQHLTAMVIVVECRSVGVGDKFSSREGNKAIIAAVVPSAALPYDKYGNQPDLVINPHAFPSRMTIGQNVEVLLSMLCLQEGKLINTTGFCPVSIPELAEKMHDLGKHRFGETAMYLPEWIEMVRTLVVFGPTGIQRLQKFITDDASMGGINLPRDQITNQPKGGKQAGGGARFGEMETWTAIGNSWTYGLNELSRNHSDGMTVYYCTKCNSPGIYNPTLGLYECELCKGNGTSLVAIPSTRAAQLFTQHLRGSGIDLSYECMVPPLPQPILTRLPGR